MEEQPKGVPPEPPPETSGIPVGKYFLHGIVFAAINFVAVIFWAFFLVVLVFLGFIIGLIIGFILFFFFLGYVNAGITSWIWQIDIKTDWRSVFGHGLVLFIVLAIVNSPSLILSLLYPGIPTAVAVFLITCFIDGYVARKIAGNWEEIYENFEVEPPVFPPPDS
jgi:hypothetical protein